MSIIRTYKQEQVPRNVFLFMCENNKVTQCSTNQCKGEILADFAVEHDTFHIHVHVLVFGTLIVTDWTVSMVIASGFDF